MRIFDSGNFTCHSDHAEAIGSVGSDFNFKNGIRKLQCGGQFLPDGQGRVQNHDPAAILTQAQFAFAAKHSFRNLSADDTFSQNKAFGKFSTGHGDG